MEKIKLKSFPIPSHVRKICFNCQSKQWQKGFSWNSYSWLFFISFLTNNERIKFSVNILDKTFFSLFKDLKLCKEAIRYSHKSISSLAKNFSSTKFFGMRYVLHFTKLFLKLFSFLAFDERFFATKDVLSFVIDPLSSKASIKILVWKAEVFQHF